MRRKSLYSVLFRPSAMRALEKLPKDDARRILGAIEILEENARPSQAKKLQGAEDLYRLRVGRFRVVYHIADTTATVTVVKIG